MKLQRLGKRSASGRRCAGALLGRIIAPDAARTRTARLALGRVTSGAARQRGASLIEFALVLPLLMVLIANVVNFGGFFFAWVTVENAARSGGQYMMAATKALGNPAPSPTTAALTSLVTTDVSSLPNNSSLALKYCTRTPSNAVTTSCSVLTGSFSSAPPDPAADSSTEASQYVMAWVDVGYTYQPFIPSGFTFPALGFGPVWPNSSSLTIQRQVVMRVLQ